MNAAAPIIILFSEREWRGNTVIESYSLLPFLRRLAYAAAHANGKTIRQWTNRPCHNRKTWRSVSEWKTQRVSMAWSERPGLSLYDYKFLIEEEREPVRSVYSLHSFTVTHYEKRCKGCERREWTVTPSESLTLGGANWHQKNGGFMRLPKGKKRVRDRETQRSGTLTPPQRYMPFTFPSGVTVIPLRQSLWPWGRDVTELAKETAPSWLALCSGSLFILVFYCLRLLLVNAGKARKERC